MLPKRSRLSRADFSDREPARHAHSAHFALRYTLKGSTPRLGVSVSKKVSKKAVVRNRIRRRVYAALGAAMVELPGGTYIISAKPGAEAVKGGALAQEVAELLKKSYNR